MKDKEKQIELLTKRISKIQNRGVKDIPNFTNIFIDNQELAEELLKHYQLVDKKSVVLSRKEYEEYQDLLKNFDNYLFEYRIFADKCIEHKATETAEKIYKEYLCDILSVEAKEEFAKQFKVELK